MFVRYCMKEKEKKKKNSRLYIFAWKKKKGGGENPLQFTNLFYQIVSTLAHNPDLNPITQLLKEPEPKKKNPVITF